MEDEEIKKLLEKKLRELMSRSRGDTINMKKHGLIYEVTDENFNELVIKRSYEVPVIVDFWAFWCAPCLILGPILEKIVKELNGSVVLAKVNVDRCPLLVSQFGIMSIPTVMLFKNGKVVDSFIGALSEGLVRRWLMKHIK